MKTENFCYWLQGMFELTGSEELTKDQVRIIKNHLNLVFEHIDLDATKHIEDKSVAEKIQSKLNETHSGNNLDDKFTKVYRC
jgi:hypothetical protein